MDFKSIEKLSDNDTLDLYNDVIFQGIENEFTASYLSGYVRCATTSFDGIIGVQGGMPGGRYCGCDVWYSVGTCKTHSGGGNYYFTDRLMMSNACGAYGWGYVCLTHCAN